MRLALVGLLLLAACHAEREPTVEPVTPVEREAEPQERGDLEWMEIRDGHYEEDQWRWQFPQWAYAAVEGTELERNYDLASDSHLFMLHGDFDGDGQVDVAAQVVSRTDPARAGTVVVHRSGGVYFFPGGGPNWGVYPRGEVEQGVEEGRPPTLRGDALYFEKPEATSTLWYWRGSEYLEYHQGD